MKKGITVLVVVAIVAMFLGLKCGCGNSSAKVDNKIAVETEISPEITVAPEIGNNDLTSDMKVTGVEIVNIEKSDPIPEPEYTFAQLLWDIYNDKFAKIMVIILVSEFVILINVLLLGIITGNLHPDHKFSLKG